MPTLAKNQAIEELTDKLGRSQLTIITDYRGLTVSDLFGFRSTLRPLDAEFRVSKNTLTRIAAGRAGVEGLEPILEGPTALVIAYGDVVSVSKAVTDFVRSSRILTIKGAALGNQLIDPSLIEDLASMPPVEELRGKLVGLLVSPISRTLGVLGGPSRSMAYLLQARAEQLGGTGEPEVEAAD